MEDAAGPNGTYGTRGFHKQDPSVRIGTAVVVSPLPASSIGRAGLRKALQSPWVQRLKPLDCSNTDSPDKRAHVWSHFAEDFSSCQRFSDRCPPRLLDAQSQKPVLRSLLLHQSICVNDLRSWRPDGPFKKDKPLHSTTFDVEGECSCVPEEEDTYSTGASIRTVYLISPGTRTGNYLLPSEALVPVSRDAHRPKALNVLKLHQLDGEEWMSDNLAVSGCSKQVGWLNEKLMDSDASIKVYNTRLKEPLVSLAVGCKDLTSVNVLSSCASGNADKERRHIFPLRSGCKMANIKGASADADNVRTVLDQVTENGFLSLSERAVMGRSKGLGVGDVDPQQTYQPSPLKKHSCQSAAHTPITAIVDWGSQVKLTNQISDPRVESKRVTGLRRFDAQQQSYAALVCQGRGSQKSSRSKNENFLSRHIVDIVHDNKLKGPCPAVYITSAANAKNFFSGNPFGTIRAQPGCSKKKENDNVHGRRMDLELKASAQKEISARRGLLFTWASNI